STVLGIHTAYADEFEAPEIIPVSSFDSSLAKIPVHSQIINRDLWILVSFDRFGSEPDEVLDADED
ncbi:hypothetical protein H0H92_008169, partial [Tricholoma furcatifolium]